MTDTSAQNRMRVAMLTQRYLPFTGGAERQLAEVLRRLPSLGVDAMVITRRHDDSPARDSIDGIPVRRIAAPGPRVAASLLYTARALRELRRFAPDVVHAHELLSPTTTAIAYKKIAGVPVIAKVLRGGSLGDVAVLSRKGLIGRMRLATIVRQVDGFAVISREIDAELQALSVPPERRHFVPNGVNMAHFHPASADEKRHIRDRLGLPLGPIALFAGRLEPEKRIDRLAAIWPRLRAELPTATLAVAGTGSLAPGLAAAQTEGVFLAGEQGDLRDWYAAADVFVLPSAAEGLSNAMLEALAMGLPCVATQVGAAPDLLTGCLGRLVPVGDDDALRVALIAALKGLPGHSPDAARAMIAQSYSIDATAQRLAELYRASIAERLARA